MKTRNTDTIAEGPAGLKQALLNLLEQSKTNPQLREKAHYVHYKHGKQESLIKINPSFDVFFHYDLWGRPATLVVKEIVANFIKEECNQQGRLVDVGRQEMLDRNKAGFLAAGGDKSRVVLSNAPITLAYARARLDTVSQTKEFATKAKKRLGLFQLSEQDSSQQESQIKHKLKP